VLTSAGLTHVRVGQHVAHASFLLRYSTPHHHRHYHSETRTAAEHIHDAERFESWRARFQCLRRRTSSPIVQNYFLASVTFELLSFNLDKSTASRKLKPLLCFLRIVSYFLLPRCIRNILMSTSIMGKLGLQYASLNTYQHLSKRPSAY
jgi:hypothetical protein